MGFMEMKRVNQDLVLEMQAIRETSEVRESKHQDTIDKLTQEMHAIRETSEVRESKHQDTIDKITQEIRTTKVRTISQ